jgi:hypothetical protein
MHKLLIAGSAAFLFLATSCSTTATEGTPDSAAPTVSSTSPDAASSNSVALSAPPASQHDATSDTDQQTIASTATAAPPETPSTPPADPDPGTNVSDATIVRFTSGDTEVDVTITADNPTARDFLAMLPLTLSLEEFNGREKITYLPRELDTDGSPGSDPEDGDLIYFVPWGNLGFYYNTDGIGYSDQVIHLGTYSASIEELTLLEGDGVTVEIVEYSDAACRGHPALRDAVQAARRSSPAWDGESGSAL